MSEPQFPLTAELGIPVYQVTNSKLETIDVVKADELETILETLFEDWEHRPIIPPKNHEDTILATP